MILPGTVASAPDGLLGFDTDTALNQHTALGFYNKGYRFCIRYVGRVGTTKNGDLCSKEALDILNSGLSLMPVQHVRMPGWVPSKAIGTQDGSYAAYNALVIGFPPGINVWCDLEGVSSDGTQWGVIGYCNAWYDAVLKAGFIPGIYVGANSILGSSVLRHSIKFSHYWKSLSKVPDPLGRGYQLFQSNEHVAVRREGVTRFFSVVNGIYIDNDTAHTDLLGGNILFLSPLTK